MDFFLKLTHFIFDNQTKLSKKVLLVIFLSFCVIFADRLFKFSDNFITSQKLQQVEKIEKLLESEKIDTLTRLKLKTIEDEVLKRETVWDFVGGIYGSLSSFISSNSWSFFKIKNNGNVNNSESSERSVFWHVVSSSWLFLFFIALIPFAPLFGDNKFDLSVIGGLLLAEILLMVFCALFSFLFAIIPVFENPNVNYFLNFVLSGVLVVFFSLRVAKPQSK